MKDAVLIDTIRRAKTRSQAPGNGATQSPAWSMDRASRANGVGERVIGSSSRKPGPSDPRPSGPLAAGRNGAAWGGGACASPRRSSRPNPATGESEPRSVLGRLDSLRRCMSSRRSNCTGLDRLTRVQASRPAAVVLAACSARPLTGARSGEQPVAPRGSGATDLNPEGSRQGAALCPWRTKVIHLAASSPSR